MKNFHFLFSPKTKFWYNKTPISLHEKTGRHQWALSCLWTSTCAHLSLTPLRMDVINGWPLIILNIHVSSGKCVVEACETQGLYYGNSRHALTENANI